MQLVLASLAAVVAAPPSPSLRVGDPAPEFAAMSHTGTSVSLKDYKGQKLLLWFYPRAGTGG